MTLGNNLKISPKSFYTVGRVLLFSLCCVIILIFCSNLTRNLPAKIIDHTSILLAMLLTFSLVLLFLNWDKLKLSGVGIIPGKYSFSRFIFGYIIGFVMATAQALIVLFYGHFQLKLVPDIAMTDILLPLLLYFFIACREELAFRSYSLRSLNISLGPFWALTVIGIIFIVEHVAGGMTWKMAVLGSGAGAILFGVSALKTKGLALSLGLHSAWNFGQWTFGFKNKPGIWEAVVEKGYEGKVENVGLTAFVIVMLIAIVGIFVYYRKSNLSV
ncbi:MAG: CPBP family intramembrane metalloprotease [Bacteroidetes bacterium]|nr:CPBP family intramembrane metalloprotease [Bacteroidota bacterium]